MTVETKLPYDQDYVRSFSDNKNEPEWMRDLRLQALDLVDGLEMPKPDKTNIKRWNFDDYNIMLMEIKSTHYMIFQMMFKCF
ncbi:iron-sulfur cluster assembly protein SufD [Gracilibacillus boraciitolerans JCM 21714]|uniref:Iron-sulfur cluster assembly protein SufD n=1 Tax=Gracilibacillus boraciitolerans JCM 21714 TaxID=1298598 RepID=W4VJB5_9BACI|nr:iron-sulfur cluster assembly protein SufD [Gracilibacillus boraciitolerans JCM 21714]